MNFLQRQRLRMLKEVAFQSGEQIEGTSRGTRAMPTARWEFDFRTSLVIAVVLIAVTVTSVWAAMAGTLGSSDSVKDGRTQAEKLLGEEESHAIPAGRDGEERKEREEADTPSSETAWGEQKRRKGSQTQSESEKLGPGKKRAGHQNANEAAPSSQGRILVHVAGAVVHPGVVEADADTRVFEALKLAGGATTQAELSAVNLATQVSDGDYIYIPTKEEVETLQKDIGTSTIQKLGAAEHTVAGPGASDTTTRQTSCIDINTAGVSALEELPGVGPALAQRIVEYREENGPFSRIADLDSVSGIGQKLIHRIEDSVCQ